MNYCQSTKGQQRRKSLGQRAAGMLADELGDQCGYLEDGVGGLEQRLPGVNACVC